MRSLRARAERRTRGLTVTPDAFRGARPEAQDRCAEDNLLPGRRKVVLEQDLLKNGAGNLLRGGALPPLPSAADDARPRRGEPQQPGRGLAR